MIKQAATIDNMSSFLIDDLEIDAKQNTVTHDSTSFPVEPRLMRVIVKLAQEAGKTVQRTDLLNEMSASTHVSDESLTQAISKIRQIFGDTSKKPKYIKTIPRKGYVLLVQPTLVPKNNNADKKQKKFRMSTKNKGKGWFEKHFKNLIIAIFLILIASIAITLWWPSKTEFIEKGDVEFIEKNSRSYDLRNGLRVMSSFGA